MFVGVAFFLSVIIFLYSFEIIGYFFLKKEYFKKYNYPQYVFEKDDEIGFTLKKNFHGVHSFTDFSYDIFSNEYGCFDKPLTNKKRIDLVLGDSHAWGYVEYGQRFSEIYSRLSNEPMMNCAVTGSSPSHQFEIIKRLDKEGITFNNVLFLYTTVNDFEGDLCFPQFSVYNGFRINKKFINDQMVVQEQLGSEKVGIRKKVASYIIQKYFFVRFFYRMINTFKKSNNNVINEEGVRKFEKRIICNLDDKNIKNLFFEHLNNIKELSSFVEDRGGEFYIIKVPMSNQLLKEVNFPINKFRYAEKLFDEYMFSNKIKNIIIDPDFNYKWEINKHLNPLGHKVIGETIFKNMKEY